MIKAHTGIYTSSRNRGLRLSPSAQHRHRHRAILQINKCNECIIRRRDKSSYSDEQGSRFFRLTYIRRELVSYLDSTSFPGSIRWQGQYCGVEDFSMSDPEAKKAHEPDRASAWKPFPFHGVALARDLWAEQYGPWVVLGFSTAFALILIALVLLGQVPGKSLALKGLSDTIQLIGEGIGLIFCARIALRLRTVTIRLKQDLAQKESGPH